MDDSGLPQARPSWWATKGKGFVVNLSRAGVMLVLLFLCVMSWFFGSAFHQSHRVHNLKILVVDFDGDAIGQSMPAAYQYLAAPSFPTLEFASPAQYPDPAALRHAVCHQNQYWGALYAQPGATRRLLDAAVDGNATAAVYNASQTLTYIYDEARYPAASDSFVKASMETLIGAARGFFYQTPTAAAALRALNTSSPAAASAFLNPILASEVNMHPVPQGARMYLNTVNMVMPIISQFFFVLALNGIAMQCGMLAALPTSRVWLVRFVAGKIYSLLLSLAITGYIWGFREGWAVHGIHFARTWMIEWLFMDVNNLLFDSLIASFVPMPFSPFIVLSWVLVNVASTVFPLELSSPFYRIGYAFPAHETYLLLVQAWTDGCFKHDYIALPVLLSWWVLATATSMLSTRKRMADFRKMAAAGGGGPGGAGGAPAGGAASAGARDDGDDGDDDAGSANPVSAGGEFRSSDKLSSSQRGADEKMEDDVLTSQNENTPNDSRLGVQSDDDMTITNDERLTRPLGSELPSKH